MYLVILGHEDHTQRPTRVIYINIKYKNPQNTTFTKFPKITKYELYNLYMLQNRTLTIFDAQHVFPTFRKCFGMFGVFVKEICILNIGFGFCVFNSYMGT